MLLLMAGAICLLAGYYFSSRERLNIWCSGQAIHIVTPDDNKTNWQVDRFDLNFQPNGQGSYRLISTLIEVPSFNHIDYRRRSSSFVYRLDGDRLFVDVVQSDDETPGVDSTGEIDLFIFKKNNNLTYNIRRLDASRYLLSNGLGGVIYCQTNTKSASISTTSARQTSGR